MKSRGQAVEIKLVAQPVEEGRIVDGVVDVPGDCDALFPVARVALVHTPEYKILKTVLQVRRAPQVRFQRRKTALRGARSNGRPTRVSGRGRQLLRAIGTHDGHNLV